MMLANMKEGGMISAHDYRVAKAPRRRCAVATSRPDRWSSEQWLLTVERKLFVELLKNPRNPAAHPAHAGNRQAAA
jgi:3-hydroxyacyl-CoA dehydrogenase